jgi:biopolymer transport protein ExbB/TolQ
MNTYLTIITTVLVLTQIIRLIQNSMQLKFLAKTRIENKEVVNAWNDLKDVMAKFIEKIESEVDGE